MAPGAHGIMGVRLAPVNRRVLDVYLWVPAAGEVLSADASPPRRYAVAYADRALAATDLVGGAVLHVRVAPGGAIRLMDLGPGQRPPELRGEWTGLAPIGEVYLLPDAWFAERTSIVGYYEVGLTGQPASTRLAPSGGVGPHGRDGRGARGLPRPDQAQDGRGRWIGGTWTGG